MPAGKSKIGKRPPLNYCDNPTAALSEAEFQSTVEFLVSEEEARDSEVLASEHAIVLIGRRLASSGSASTPLIYRLVSLSRSIDTQSLRAEYNSGKLHCGANVASMPILKATAYIPLRGGNAPPRSFRHENAHTHCSTQHELKRHPIIFPDRLVCCSAYTTIAEVRQMDGSHGRKPGILTGSPYPSSFPADWKIPCNCIRRR